MTRCTCGGGHETFGACVRAKNVKVAYCQSSRGLDASAEKAKDKELALYRSAREQGVQPSGTRTAQTRQALDVSDMLGRPYDAGDFGGSIGQ